jgi:hypothetical protein
MTRRTEDSHRRKFIDGPPPKKNPLARVFFGPHIMQSALPNRKTFALRAL